MGVFGDFLTDCGKSSIVFPGQFFANMDFYYLFTVNLYRKAEKTYEEFSKSTGADLPLASEQDFVSRVLRAEATGELSSAKDEGALELVLLPKIIQGSDNIDTMTKITKWFSNKSKSLSKHKKL